jgi:hypothetical protein
MCPEIQIADALFHNLHVALVLLNLPSSSVFLVALRANGSGVITPFAPIYLFAC